MMANGSQPDSQTNTTQKTISQQYQTYVYDGNRFSSTIVTVFLIFANDNLGMKVNTFINTGAMKSVMS